jgi:hypothetical protein
MAGRFSTVDEYVAGLPEAVQPVMERIRRSIRAVVPDIADRNGPVGPPRPGAGWPRESGFPRAAG